MFSALRNPQFRLLWLGSLSAFVGFFASNVVQAVVAFNLTHRNDAVGKVTFGRGLAQLLFAPIGGALADRLSKRSILLSSQSLTAGVFFVLAWFAASGSLTVTDLAAGGFVVGLTFSVLGPTRSAYVLELVEPTCSPTPSPSTRSRSTRLASSGPRSAARSSPGLPLVPPARSC